MVVLSVDLSTKKSGYAIFNDFLLIKQGVIASKDKDVLHRIHYMTDELTKIYEENNCCRLIVEGVPNMQNTNTYAKLLWCQGSLLAALVGSEICNDYEILYPSEWRSKLSIRNGKGVKRKEVKAATKKFVYERFGEELEEDICDAICIGLASMKKGD